LDGDYLYIRDSDFRVVICEAKIRKKGNKIVGHAEGSVGRVNRIFIYKGCLVTCASDDPTVRVWSSVTGKRYAQLKGHNDAVNSITLFGPGMIMSGGEVTRKL